MARCQCGRRSRRNAAGMQCCAACGPMPAERHKIVAPWVRAVGMLRSDQAMTAEDREWIARGIEELQATIQQVHRLNTMMADVHRREIAAAKGPLWGWLFGLYQAIRRAPC
jgi:hypothetical protein